MKLGIDGLLIFLSSGELRLDLKSRWKTYVEWQKSLPSPFEKLPVGYQRTLLCSLLDKLRTVE